MVKIAIIHYSLYGHVAKMSESVKKGVLSTGAECDIYQVEETLSDEILTKMNAPQKADYPIISAEQMEEYDGFLFGVSGRFGLVGAQMKRFLDSTGKMWFSRALFGKPAGLFFSTASFGGGQESIAMSTVSFFASHGMPYIPFGCPVESILQLDEVQGGSVWGTGTYSGIDGKRMPTETELKLCEIQGEKFAEIAAKLAPSKKSKREMK